MVWRGLRIGLRYSCWIIGAALGLAMTMAIMRWSSFEYGWLLFFCVPCVMGFVTSALYSLDTKPTFWKAFGVCAGALAMFGLGILAFSLDGLVCILMAFPLALAPAALGCGIGLRASAALRDRRSALPPSFPLIVLLGISAANDFYHPDRMSQAEFASSVDIAAPPNVVWDRIEHLSKLPPAKDWMARLGIACPESTELKGKGLGAERDCALSTGPMKERVTVWSPQRRLGFVPLQTPPPMQELNPFGTPHPDHLTERYFRITYGEFRLDPLSDGGTRLTRITRYEHRLSPVMYWTFWSNMAAGYAHARVLGEVKAESEVRRVVLQDSGLSSRSLN